jgi:hypothetical protein
MSARRRYPKPLALGQFLDRTAHTDQLAARFLNVVTDEGPYLHLRLQKFGTDLIGQDHLALLKEPLHVGAHVPGSRVDDLVLFFDTNGERWGYHVYRRFHYITLVSWPKVGVGSVSLLVRFSKWSKMFVY